MGFRITEFSKSAKSGSRIFGPQRGEPAKKNRENHFFQSLSRKSVLGVNNAHWTVFDHLRAVFCLYWRAFAEKGSFWAHFDHFSSNEARRMPSRANLTCGIVLNGQIIPQKLSFWCIGRTVIAESGPPFWRFWQILVEKSENLNLKIVGQTLQNLAKIGNFLENFLRATCQKKSVFRAIWGQINRFGTLYFAKMPQKCLIWHPLFSIQNEVQKRHFENFFSIWPKFDHLREKEMSF